MSTRIKGRAALFSLAGTDYSDDCTSIQLLNEEGDTDTLTFADAAAGETVQWYFEITAIQSTEAGSLWRYLFDNAGTADVAWIFAPHGNAAPSATQPHFTGTLDLPAKPSIGGEAGADNTYTFEARLDVDGTPTMDTTP